VRAARLPIVTTTGDAHMQRHVLASALLGTMAIAGCSTVSQDEARSAPGADADAVASPMPPSPPPREAVEAKVVAAGRSAQASLHRRTQAAPAALADVAAMGAYAPAPALVRIPGPQPADTEKYAIREDNPVHRTSEQPVSTFSIDVDTGSYANVRRMLDDGMRPPADAVRAEEMINYFRYGHAAPDSLDVPFRVTTELAPAPWNGKRQLLMIGIKGYDVPKATLPPANLVLLIDTSGSMNAPDKLPLLKQSMKQLVNQLRPQDHVSIVVYAGSAGLVLAPTSGDRGGEILAALERLEAGGSTNGGDGIRLAYAMAKQGYVQGGVNRVILATDGDFNVGTVDQGALETLVSDQRKAGIALTTLGFGRGNYNDALAEQLADVGDGNHAYIDSLSEARKVLVQEMGSTLLTIARDVKIQVEFNPALVAEYRLVGYENRVLRNEDFANDKVDAGDIGAGHEVTALYEITPVGSGAEQLPALRYGAASAATGARPNGTRAEEVAHLRLRYKRPGEDDSRLIATPIMRSSLRATPSDTLRFAATVAAYADALRGGSRIGDWSWDEILRNARAVQDGNPQRAEFVGLVETAQALVGADRREAAVAD
jgi:Ca-activated chloride channel homolog